MWDQVINSHCNSVLQSIAATRRNLIVITLRVQRVKFPAFLSHIQYSPRPQQIEILMKALNTVVTWWDDTKSRNHILIKVTSIKSKCSHLNNDGLLKGRQYLRRNHKEEKNKKTKTLFSIMNTNTALERATVSVTIFQKGKYYSVNFIIIHENIVSINCKNWL